jgi:DNA-binding MarR family transcriptional regulator
MAVMTFTKRQVVDMIPEFLSKRATGYVPRGQEYAKELGIPWPALLVLGAAFVEDEGDGTMRSWYLRRTPYLVKDARPASWDQLIAAGYASKVEDSRRVTRRLTPKGAAASAEHQRRVMRYVASLDLPSGPLERAATQFDRLAHRVPADAERAGRMKRWWALHPDLRSTVRTLSDAAQVLWGFRDDCHIAAWQAAGYKGPELDVLSFAWSGATDISWTKIGGAKTIADLVKSLETKQEPADVERNVDALVAKGDLTRDGDSIRITAQGQSARDAIEAETDRRYFTIWDLDDAATSRLGDDLRAVIDALPKA